MMATSHNMIMIDMRDMRQHKNYTSCYIANTINHAHPNHHINESIDNILVFRNESRGKKMWGVSVFVDI